MRRVSNAFGMCSEVVLGGQFRLSHRAMPWAWGVAPDRLYGLLAEESAGASTCFVQWSLAGVDEGILAKGNIGRSGNSLGDVGITVYVPVPCLAWPVEPCDPLVLLRPLS